MNTNKSPFYIASIVVLRLPLRYVISTNAGVSVYNRFDDLPQFCKDFLKVHLNQALNLDDVVLVGRKEFEVHE